MTALEGSGRVPCRLSKSYSVVDNRDHHFLMAG